MTYAILRNDLKEFRKRRLKLWIEVAQINTSIKYEWGNYYELVSQRNLVKQEIWINNLMINSTKEELLILSRG